MKRIRIFAVALAALLLAGAACGAEEAVCGAGLDRAAGGIGFALARAVAERYGILLTDDLPLYAPANPQPMNAYMVIAPECQVGIDGDDMYPVSEKGLVPQITESLTAWIHSIEDQSGGLIRFVADPDDADVLVSACQSYRYYGRYGGGGRTAEGYACVVTLTAVQLTDSDNRAGLSAVREPEDAVTLRGGDRFWKTPPELAGTEKLAAFVEGILGWYGYEARSGSRGAGVRAIQQALIDRGFLDDSADGDFGPRTGAAVQRLQEYAGLEPTGVVDGATLLAAYYEPDSGEVME